MALHLLVAPPIPLGYQQLTVSSVALALTLPARGCRMAVITVENNPIRYRDDGTNPTSTVGMPVQALDSVILYGASIAAFRAIRSGSDAILNISYYGDL